MTWGRDILSTSSEKCPCGGETFASCCEPVILGAEQARTAEQMMRARYTAYATGAIDFLAESNHSKTRREFSPEDAQKWSAESNWLGLEILATESAIPTRAHVNFEARYEDKDGTLIVHRERSLFEQEDGEWRFVNGGGIPVTSEKVGRNDPCPCGSGKKHKKCCGA
jgi:SEC-C motif-containing protein